jgi:hypothetical protein
MLNIAKLRIMAKQCVTLKDLLNALKIYGMNITVETTVPMLN